MRNIAVRVLTAMAIDRGFIGSTTVPLISSLDKKASSCDSERGGPCCESAIEFARRGRTRYCSVHSTVVDMTSCSEYKHVRSTNPLIRRRVIRADFKNIVVVRYNLADSVWGRVPCYVASLRALQVVMKRVLR